MSEDIAIAELLRTRAALAGQIDRRVKRATKLRGQLVHVDSTLRILGFDGPGLVKKNKRIGTSGMFARNELRRTIRALLASNKDGLTARQIALEICRQKAWDADIGPLLESLTRRVGHTLTSHARKTYAICERVGTEHVWRMR